MTAAPTRPRPNYFAEGDYLTTDGRKGVMRNRAGTRMVALTADFLLGLREALDLECGPGADLVLRTCGRTWGAAFAKRVEGELAAFHGAPIQGEPLALFEATLAGMFSHHGWGSVRFDFARHPQGVLVAAVTNPVMAGLLGTADRNADPLLAGVLAGTLGHFSGQELDGLQTQCQARGHADSLFVLARADRLAPVRDWPAQGKTHADILAALTTPAP